MELPATPPPRTRTRSPIFTRSTSRAARLPDLREPAEPPAPLLLPTIVEEMPIVTAIEKQTHISSTAKNVAAGIPLGLSLDDSDGHREAENSLPN